ncbi:MAG TPA: hypothetical protein VGC80_08470, partial [Acetobacteraceae bacterium]
WAPNAVAWSVLRIPGWRALSPAALDEAIRRTIEWERSNPPGEFNPHRFDYAAEDAALRDLPIGTERAAV